MYIARTIRINHDTATNFNNGLEPVGGRLRFLGDTYPVSFHTIYV